MVHGGSLARALGVTMGDGSKPFGDDALRKRGDTMGTMATRRAEAVQALRGWPWLDELRLRFDLAIEIIGPDLDYMFDPLPELHSSARLRGVLSGAAELLAIVVQAGRPKVFASAEFRVRLAPLVMRSAASPTQLGVLAVAAPVADYRLQAEDTSEADDRRLEVAAQWLVAAIEANLSATLKDVVDARDLERTAGSFDVVDALTQLSNDREIIGLLMDAVALWYDADVYAYQQDLSGTFTLFASLPGVSPDRAVPQLLGHQIWGRSEVFSADSHGALEALGWSASFGHTLFLPVLVDQSTEWLLAISGVADDPAIRQTLGVFGRVAGSLLTDLQHQSMNRLARKLTSVLLFGNAPVPATAQLAFEAVAAETGASSVQFAAYDTDKAGSRRVLSLQWGGAETDSAPFVDAETTSLSAQSIAVGVGTGSGVTAVLSLRRDAGAFSPVAQHLARSAAATIGIWLSGSLVQVHELHAPESAAEQGGELVQRLRSRVDRFGHVTVAGAVAVVLPPTKASEGELIDEAVDLLEHHVRPSDVIGAVGTIGAGVLLANATRDVASAVVGRLLRAAREKGFMAVRVGVAMFAASTESPEAVLERALMNARRGSAV